MPSNSSRNVRAGGAFVELFMKDGAFNATLRNVGQKLKTFGMAALVSGAAISGVGIAAASPFLKAVQTFASFDDAMAQVRANLNPTSEQFQKLQDEAERLGRTMKFTATEAAQATHTLSLAGFSAEEIMDSLGGTLQLAAVGKMDLADAADITAKTLRGMNMAASESARVTDVLALGSVTANTTVHQLGEAFKHSAPLAKSFGMSVEELTAAVQIMSDAGVQGEMAGTSMRGVILSLTSPTKEASDELTRLGVSVTDQTGKIRPFVDILTDLESAYRPLANGAKLESLGTIFPARQAAGLDALLSKGSDALRAKTEALQDAAGTAARVSAQQMDSLVGDVVIAESTAEGFFIRLGRMFGPMLRTITQATTFLIAQATEWIGKNQETVYVVAGVLAAVIGLGSGLTALGLTALATGFIFSGLASAFGVFSGAMGIVAAGFGLLMSPVGLALRGVLMLYRAGGLLTTGLTSGLKALGLQGTLSLSSLYALFQSLGANLVDQMGAAVELVVGLVRGAGSAFAELASAAWRSVVMLVQSTPYLGAAFSMAASFARSTLSFVVDLGNGVWWYASRAVSAVGTIASAIGTVLRVAGSLIAPFLGRLASVPLLLAEAASWALGSLTSAAVKVVSYAASQAGRLAAYLFSPVMALVNPVLRFAGAALSMVSRIARSVVSTASAAASAALQAVASWSSAAWSIATSYLGSIQTAAGSLFSGLSTWASSVTGVLSQLFGELSGIAGEAFGAIKDALAAGEYQAAANVLWSALNLVWTKGTSTISELWRSTAYSVTETWKSTVEILAELWRNLIAGVQSQLGQAQNKTASWIIEAQRMAGVLTDLEAQGAQEELANMGRESQQRISDGLKQENDAANKAADERQQANLDANRKAAQESAKAVAEAQAEYDAALEAARNAKPKDKPTVPGKKGGVDGIDFDGINNTVVATQAKSAATVSGGTFSSLASQIFGAGKDDTAKKQLTALQSIDKKMGNLGTEWQS
jgi:TP901 family phage tail tape measure protein